MPSDLWFPSLAHEQMVGAYFWKARPSLSEKMQAEGYDQYNSYVGQNVLYDSAQYEVRLAMFLQLSAALNVYFA